VFPVAAAVGVVVILIRVINAAQNSNGGGATTNQAGVVQTSRGSTNYWSDSGAAGTLVFQLILLPMCIGLTAFALESGSLGALSFAALCAWFLFPSFLARSVFAPLGFIRLAFTTAQLSRVAWRRDKPGGPALIAAWGLAQQEKPWPSSIAWVENKLNASKRALQGSGVVARGLLEAAKGNHESARVWIESVLMFDPRVAPTHVRAIAAEWLATDAAARGDWKRVKAICENPKWPGSRPLTLLGAIAGRMLGEPMPTNAGLWMWWFFAPRRLWTLGFVRRASAHRPSGPKPELSLPAAPETLEPMGRATFLTLALKQSSTPSTASVINVARAWEAALSSDLRSKLFVRSTMNGGGEPDAAIDEVRQLIETALVPLLPAKLTGAGELPMLLESAAQERRNRIHNELEDKMNRMEQRKLAQRELPQLEEWNEFLSLRALYRQACDASASLSDVSLAHSIIRDKLVNFAVWLYNDRTEKPLANAIFRLLEAEAVALGDAESERLNKKNSNCDL
jgi:hypothetical protein